MGSKNCCILWNKFEHIIPQINKTPIKKVVKENLVIFHTIHPKFILFHTRNWCD